MIVPHIRKDARTERFIVDHQGADEKRHQPGFKLKREAAEKLAEISGEKKRAGECGHSVASLVPRFFANLRANGKAEHTVINYKNIIDRHLVPKVGDLDLLAIDIEVVRELRLQLFSELSVKHASSSYSVFCSMLDDAESWRLIDGHCARDYRRGAWRDNEIRSISLPTTDELFIMHDGPLCAAKVAIALGTLAGLRTGEMRALTPRSIDLDEGYISIRETVGAKGVLKRPKGVAGERQVPIGEELGQILGDWMTRERFADSDYIFAVEDRRIVPYTTYIPKITQRYQRSLGIPSRRSGHYLGYNMHLFRHVCVALWIEAGADADWVRQKIGHQYLHTTLDIYGGLFDEAQEPETPEMLLAA
jgi:integrase